MKQKIEGGNKRISKTFENSSGNILVRDSSGQSGACGIVEILHLYDNNKSGCVIGAFVERDCDGYQIAEFQEVHDRLTTTPIDSDELIMQAIRYGRKLAEVILISNNL